MYEGNPGEIEFGSSKRGLELSGVDFSSYQEPYITGPIMALVLT